MNNLSSWLLALIAGAGLAFRLALVLFSAIEQEKSRGERASGYAGWIQPDCPVQAVSIGLQKKIVDERKEADFLKLAETIPHPVSEQVK